MSAKNLDRHNRWRNKTVAFRVSPEEDREIETAVRLSGLTKQDYITRRLLCRDVVVQGNPRVPDFWCYFTDFFQILWRILAIDTKLYTRTFQFLIDFLKECGDLIK